MVLKEGSYKKIPLQVADGVKQRGLVSLISQHAYSILTTCNRVIFMVLDRKTEILMVQQLVLGHETYQEED